MDFPDILEGLRGAGKDLPGFVEEDVSSLRQGNAPLAAGYERDAGFALEVLYLPAERRMGNVQPRRGAPQIQLLGHRDEVAQMP